MFAATLAASVTADIVARLLLGQTPVFHVAIEAIPELALLPLASVVGLAAAVFGVAFNRGLLASLNAFDRLRARAAWAPAATAGLLTGLVLWFAPSLVGTGRALMDDMLTGDIGLLALTGIFAIRFVLVLAAYGCGAPGGIFAPHADPRRRARARDRRRRRCAGDPVRSTICAPSRSSAWRRTSPRSSARR